MRLMNFLVCVLLCGSFIACSDDDNDNDSLELSVDYLNICPLTGLLITLFEIN